MSDPATNDKIDVLQWGVPAGAEPPVGLGQILVGLQLLATDEDRARATEPAAQKWDWNTPLSLQALKSGATQVTQHWSKLLSRAGGATGILTLLAAGAAAVTDKLGMPVSIALLGAGAVILAGTVIAVALLICADLEARGRATAARHSGRAEVAAAFLAATASLAHEDAPGATGDAARLQDQLLLLAATAPRLKVATGQGKAWQAVQYVEQAGDGVLLHLDAGGQLRLDEVVEWTTR